MKRVIVTNGKIILPLILVGLFVGYQLFVHVDMHTADQPIDPMNISFDVNRTRIVLYWTKFFGVDFNVQTVSTCFEDWRQNVFLPAQPSLKCTAPNASYEYECAFTSNRAHNDPMAW